MQEISVKVYEFDGPAVRRFPFRIPAEGIAYAGMYATLVEKVKEICALDSNIEIVWKDEEGDVIVISSDEEVTEALRHRNGDMFRIFVRLSGRSESVPVMSNVRVDNTTTTSAPMMEDESQPATKPKENEGSTTNGGPTVHNEVICDGCDMNNIEGARFKCLVCRDYDLCAECVGKHVHDQHPMVRIAAPSDRSWWPAFAASQGINNPRGFFHHGRGHGRGHGHGGRRGRCPFFAGPQGTDGDQQQQQQNGGNNNATCGGGQRPDQQQQPTPGDVPVFPFMRDIGQAVAAVLNGFGIDVDIDVEHGGQRTKVATPKSQAEKQPETQQTDPQVQTDGQQEPKSTTPVADQPMENVASPPAVENTDNGQAAANGQQDWMILDVNDSGVKETPVAAAAASAPPTSTDPRVVAGLNYMLAMGFTNEGGWLTQLLEAKGGDIAAVLEILHPEEKRGC